MQKNVQKEDRPVKEMGQKPRSRQTLSFHKKGQTLLPALLDLAPRLTARSARGSRRHHIVGRGRVQSGDVKVRVRRSGLQLTVGRAAAAEGRAGRRGEGSPRGRREAGGGAGVGSRTAEGRAGADGAEAGSGGLLVRLGGRPATAAAPARQVATGTRSRAAGRVLREQRVNVSM